MITPLRRPFVIRLLHANIVKRIVAIEHWPHSTFLRTDDCGALNHRFVLAMIKKGEAMFDVERKEDKSR